MGFYFPQGKPSSQMEMNFSVAVWCDPALLRGLLLFGLRTVAIDTSCSITSSQVPKYPPWSQRAIFWGLQDWCRAECPACWPKRFLYQSWPRRLKFPYRQSKHRLVRGACLISQMLTKEVRLTLTEQSSIISIFYGLISLCIMLLEWSICNPCATVLHIRHISFSSIIR